VADSVSYGPPPGADPNHYVDPQTGVLRVQGATPGVSGAINGLIAVLANAWAPRTIVQRRQYIDNAVNQADPTPGPGPKPIEPLGQQFSPQ
jgi:hypothetical protein